MSEKPSKPYFIKLFRPLILFLFITSGASAQSLPEVGSVWTYHYRQALDMLDETYQIQFEITEHTALSGRECAKMESVGGNQHFGCEPVSPPYYIYQTGDTLYYATEYDNTFRPTLYYGAQAGDTWEYAVPAAEYNSTDTFLVTVVSTSIVEADGQELRSLELSYENLTAEEDQWITIYPEPYTFKVTEVLGLHGRGFLPLGEIGGTHFACDGTFNEVLQCFDSPSLSWVEPSSGSCSLNSDDESPLAGFRLWPNPAVDFLLIDGLPLGEASIEVRSATGAVVQSERSNAEASRLNLRGLAPGLYLVTVRDGEHAVSRKFVKN